LTFTVTDVNGTSSEFKVIANRREGVMMQQLRVEGYTISVDGYGAGPNQSRENPLGVGGEALHEWLVGTRTFAQMQRKPGGSTGIDEDFAARGFENVGAWIMGRNMFAPSRGPWPDDGWRGWWGKNPPYHVPVYVLTSHARDPIVMEGGTVFHFVTGGIQAALNQAFAAAGGKDVRIGGGASTIRQYLQARLIDRMHLAISPLLLGSGEHLLEGIDLLALGYNTSEQVASDKAMHVVITKRE
jgi:dihydrofolate reductase